MGVVKIAYEYTATFLAEYIDDPYSEIFSKILLSGDVGEAYKSYFTEDTEVKFDLVNRMLRFRDLQPYHNMVMLATIPGKGLFCLTKIFSSSYLIKLSSLETYLNVSELVLANDCVNQTWLMNTTARLSVFSIQAELSSFSRLNRRIVQRCKEDWFKLHSDKYSII